MSSERTKRILDLVCSGFSEDPWMVYQVPMHLLKLHVNFYVHGPCCHLLEKAGFKKIIKESLKQEKKTKTFNK